MTLMLLQVHFFGICVRIWTCTPTFPLRYPRVSWSASFQVGFVIHGLSHMAAAFLLDLSPTEQPVENQLY